MILVKVISFEELLCRRILKVDFILFYSFRVFPFLIVYVVLVKVLVVRVWQIRGQHSTFVKSVPSEVLEPRVVFDFVIAIEAQSAGSFTSETLN